MKDHFMTIEVGDDADNDTIQYLAQEEIDNWVNNNIYGIVDLNVSFTISCKIEPKKIWQRSHKLHNLPASA